MAQKLTGSADVVILGGGSGGYACALRAAQLGLSVVMIEAGSLGGTCLHTGCIPTKALLHAAEIADSVREASTFGIEATLGGVDMTAVNKYKDEVVAGLYRGLQGLVASREIELVAGRGRVVDDRTVEVELADGGIGTYRGEALVLATGSQPKSLPGLNIGGSVMTSDRALELDHVPDSVVVLGGGVIGCEFASVWTSLGAHVTIVEAAATLLPTEDPWTTKQIERAFRKRGITLRTKTAFSGVTERPGGGVHVDLDDGSQIEADLMLVAVGRGPRTADMGFEESGVELDRGFVVTDEWLQTTVPGVFAVGDIVAGPQLAHRGFSQGMLVAEQLAGLDCTPVEDTGIPRVTYSNPEVASVGLTESEAAKQFGEVITVVYDLAGNGKSRILRTSGGVKLVQAGPEGRVVGIHLVGERVGELIGEAQLIYNWQATAGDVAQHVHAHPTQAEALGEAHLALAGKALHAHS